MKKFSSISPFSDELVGTLFKLFPMRSAVFLMGQGP
jgi:hypothetical protein